MTIAKGDTVYLADGTKCEYHGPVVGGKHLIYILSRLHEDADSDLFTQPHIASPDEFYLSPPVAEKEARIQELDSQISDRVTRLIRVQEELRQAEYQKQELAKQTLRHEALQHVIDFLEGRIKFVVIEQGTEYTILPLDEALQDTSDRRGELRLISLYGNLKQEVSWTRNRYSDGSGSDYRLWPFKTLEAAREFLQAHISAEVEHELKQLNMYKLNGYEQSYKRLNTQYGFALKLPEAAVAALNKQKRINAIGQLAVAESKVSELRSLLSSLEPPE